MSQHSLFASDDELDDDWESEEDEIYAGIFGLVLNDIPVIQRLIGCVRKVIARRDVTALQIHDLAGLLWGLERLPAPTSGLDVSLSIGRHYENGESRFSGMALSHHSFRLETESYIIIDPSAGGDSMAATIFEAEVGGYRSMENPFAVGGWLDDFEEACGEMDKEIDVTNYGEVEIDWSEEPNPELWERLDFDGGWSMPFIS